MRSNNPETRMRNTLHQENRDQIQLKDLNLTVSSTSNILLETEVPSGSHQKMAFLRTGYNLSRDKLYIMKTPETLFQLFCLANLNLIKSLGRVEMGENVGYNGKNTGTSSSY